MASPTNGESWQVRAARNQSMFRAVNEHLSGVGEARDATLVIACECADTECTETVEISRSKYEQIRDDPNRFAVRDGHVYPDVEDVVEASGEFVVVAKRGEGGAVAAALDPNT